MSGFGKDITDLRDISLCNLAQKKMAKGPTIDVDFEKLINSEADERAFQEALTLAHKISEENFGKRIRFYAPSFMYYKTEHYRSSPSAFPSISVTGSSCALKCKHCGGTLLKTMHPATTPERLVTLCRDLKQKGAVGCLISGGCRRDGSVPLEGFIDAIARIKREQSLIMAVHTGVIDLKTAASLKKAGVDAALIDIIGSNETIKEIYQLDAHVSDYERSLANLSQSGIPLVPHVLVGLHYGKLKGELQALRMISKHTPAAVIVISFMPIRGTMMEKIKPPRPIDVGRVLVVARLMMPNTPLVLGCMRPRGRQGTETDMLAIKAGVNAIAFPAEAAIRLAERLGFEASFSSCCCSQVYLDVKRGF